jgi:isocitrate dehydrogenase
VVPYVVTKKTVFKWQEGFWVIMKKVFDEHYKEKFLKAGLLDKCGGELQHLISDAATMQIIRWTGGGFGMAAHNYDGDMLTDEIAQVHRSPGFITSNLIGKMPDGRMIKEFEASHGTVADLYHMMLRGEETSFNPLGMVEALIGAMQHAATLDTTNKDAIDKYCLTLRKAMHQTFVEGNGTRDMCGPSGLTTEQFLDKVIANFIVLYDGKVKEPAVAPPVMPSVSTVDKDKVKSLFDMYDLDSDGAISLAEFENALVKLGVAPMQVVSSSDKTSEITDNVKP